MLKNQVTRFEYDFNNGSKIADIDACGTRTEYNARDEQVLIRYPDGTTESTV